MKISLKSIRDNAAKRPDGYYEAIIAAGDIRGDMLLVDDKKYFELLNMFRRGWPRIADLKIDYAHAIGDVKKRGWPVADEIDFKERYEVCKECECWGAWCKECSVLLWLEFETCPLKKW